MSDEVKVTKKIPIHVQSSQTRILIKGGRCVNDDQMFDADVYIEDGKIKQVGPHLVVPGGSRVIEARGLYVLPGGIDTHTHFQFPFMGTRTIDDFYSGTKAALAGGTTMVIDFAWSDGNLIDNYQRWRNWADEKVCCDYGLHVVVKNWKDGVTDKEIETLVKEKGVNSFKCFMAYKKEGSQLSDEELIKLFNACKTNGALPMVHAENGDVIEHLQSKLLRLGVTGPEGHLQARPEEVEAEATHRAITLANQVGSPLYVAHVMSKSAAEEIVRARSRGSIVIGEALAAAIGTDGTHYFNRCWQHAAGHVMSPPLRPDKGTPEYLINLLACGQLETTGSDHCAFSSQQKALGQNDFTKIPNGVNGVEERLMVLWEKGVKTGKLDPCKFVAVTSSNAAKVFNIYPRKGRIAVGSDADIVIWGKKPKTIRAENHNSLVDFNIFEGMSVEHSPIVVISNGRVVLDEDGALHLSQGSGRFIPMPPFPNLIFSRVIEREVNMGPIKVDRSGEVKKEVLHNNFLAEPQITASKHADLSAIPYSGGPPSPVPSSAGSGTMTPTGFHKIQTRSGVRNLQDSTFKLTGEQIDDDRMSRTGIKVHNPPGGKSHGLW
ncbi:dihydropyrimidinase-like isoform X4 [Dinothrombium tinctorium]|uniref:dihydropyrimidinase n=1 Tax=Dinothrombium tinctorium TaxID=1965070 RepID=A0A3S3RTD7_9ACAR|nr:dihydropyrimidinase-like isoform X4 [Dinothrombium tinctorium]